MIIAVTNKSTRFTDPHALAAMVDACNRQAREHVGPAWGILPPLVALAPPGALPTGAWPLVIMDDADQAGALGYHAETPGGQPYGRVFVSPVLDNGGTALHGPNSISMVLSHECCETICDARVNLWAADAGGVLWALESADWTEGDAYEIDGVSVSNFVYPSAFDPQSTAPFDHMNLMHVPFDIRHGGYAVVNQRGVLKQIFGDMYPVWKLATKAHPAARTAKRLRAPRA